MEALLEALNGFSSKPLTEVEVRVLSDFKYVVKIYNRNNEEDLAYIKANKAKIKKFMDAGYEDAGLGKFNSCYNKDSVANNTILLKVAETMDGQILAMSIYTSYLTGFKCVGITKLVTSDTLLNQLAKDAIKYIIKEDISHFRDFYWTECSGVIEHWWSKYSGDMLRIPVTYLPVIFGPKVFNSDKFKLIENDDYHYKRVLTDKDGEEYIVKKCLFGFPNVDVLNEFINGENIDLDEFIKKIEKNVVLEHMFDGIPSDVRNARKVISYITGTIEENCIYEITEHWMEVFNERVELIRNFLKERGGRLSEIKREDLYDAIDYGFSIINMCSILKPYEIGEEFIPEKNIYNEPQQIYY